MSEPPLQHSNSDDDWGQYETEAESDASSHVDISVPKPHIEDPSKSTEDLLKESTTADGRQGTRGADESAAGDTLATLSGNGAELLEKMHKSPEPIPTLKHQQSSNQNKKSSTPVLKGTNNNQSNGGLRGSMHSSPSFKELEMAIGQQLAMGISSEVSSNNCEGVLLG